MDPGEICGQLVELFGVTLNKKRSRTLNSQLNLDGRGKGPRAGGSVEEEGVLQQNGRRGSKGGVLGQTQLQEVSEIGGEAALREGANIGGRKRERGGGREEEEEEERKRKGERTEKGEGRVKTLLRLSGLDASPTCTQKDSQKQNSKNPEQKECQTSLSR